MAIVSSTFGRITLTEKDAEKFDKQVRFGKPKSTAKASVKSGVEMSKTFRDNGGRISLKLKRG